MELFSIVDKESIPEITKIVDIKWVYKIKRGPDGTIEKYKARNVS